MINKNVGYNVLYIHSIIKENIDLSIFFYLTSSCTSLLPFSLILSLSFFLSLDLASFLFADLPFHGFPPRLARRRTEV